MCGEIRNYRVLEVKNDCLEFDPYTRTAQAREVGTLLRTATFQRRPMGVQSARPAGLLRAKLLAESRLRRLPTEAEPHHTNPTAEEVDAYIDSLECEMARECARMQPNKGDGLLWWLLAVAMGCFAGLVYLIS